MDGLNNVPNSNNNKSFRDYRKHRIPAIAELIDTEERYLNTLEKVVYGYMIEYYSEKSKIPVPKVLKEHDGYLIFGNIFEIYEWHKHYFLDALKENQYSVRSLSKIFTQNETQFHMYAKYSINKSISEYLINTNLSYFDEIKKTLKHKNSLGDFMIAPVQRLAQYKLLLEEILKHLKKNNLVDDIDSLNEACNMIKKVGNEANEFAALNGIKNFDGLISAQGKLLHRGPLICNYNGKRCNLYVFLFKRIMLFTEKQEPKKKYLIPTYDFRLQIPMNKLRMKELTNCKFFLELIDPNVPNCTVICQAQTREDHKKWIQAIKQQLALQMKLIHELVHPNTDDIEVLV